MVFQAYALFPNMNVFDNVAFGLKVAGTSKAETAARVEEMLKLIGLSGFEKRFPFEMSGGHQQRVALARALAPSPRMLLLDAIGSASCRERVLQYGYTSVVAVSLTKKHQTQTQT